MARSGSFPFAGKRIGIVGDSHIEALGPALKRRLQAQGATVPIVMPRRGWSTRRFAGAADLGSRMRPHRLDVLIISLGGNDFQEPSLSRYLPQLERVAQMAKTAARQVIWLGPATSIAEPVKSRFNQLATWQESVLPQMGVEWVDSRRMTRAGHARDGLHYTRAGYEGWAETLMDDLAAGSTPAGYPWVPIGIGVIAAGVFYATLRWVKAP